MALHKALLYLHCIVPYIVFLLSVFLHSEPCPPSNVETYVGSKGGQGTISWEPSWGAEDYEVNLIGTDGHSLTCYSNNTSCSVKGLHCGISYNTTVIATGETLAGRPSTPVLLVSGTVEHTKAKI